MFNYYRLVAAHMLISVTPRSLLPFAALFDSLKEGDVCVDCGASVGLISDHMSQKGARVFAFEPDPVACEAFMQRLAGRKRVTLFRKAVWTAKTQMDLFSHCDRQRNPLLTSVASSFFPDKKNVDSRVSHKVRTIDLAAFIKGLKGKVKILKMDVEGAEYAILNSLISLGVMNNVDYVLVETHAKKIPSLREADKALRERIKSLGLGKKINLNWM